MKTLEYIVITLVYSLIDAINLVCHLPECNIRRQNYRVRKYDKQFIMFRPALNLAAESSVRSVSIAFPSIIRQIWSATCGGYVTIST